MRQETYSLNIELVELLDYANARYAGASVPITIVLDDIANDAEALNLHKEFLVRHFIYLNKKYKMTYEDFFKTFNIEDIEQ